MSRSNGTEVDEALLHEQDEHRRHQRRHITGSEPTSLIRLQAWNLYTSHLLSTWNARAYEFAAVSFLAYTAIPATSSLAAANEAFTS